jgi:hypothetical protein
MTLLLLFNQPVAAVTLSPPLHTDPDSFFPPLVEAGPVALAPAPHTNTPTFFPASIGAGEVTLAPAPYTNAQTFFPAAVAAGPVSLSPTPFTNSQIFYAPAAQATITLLPTLATNAPTSPTPTVVQGTDTTLLPPFFRKTAYVAIVTQA